MSSFRHAGPAGVEVTHCGVRTNRALGVRSFVLCLLAVCALLVMVPAPAHAATGPANRPGLLAGTPLTLAVPLPVIGKTLSVDVAGVSLVAHVPQAATAEAGPTYRPAVRLLRPVRVAHRSAALARATTAPGLVSVVPIGPMPTGLRPHVAAKSVLTLTRAAAPNQPGARGLPAPPTSFWFALVLLALLLGTTTFLVADRGAYRVAVSITKR
jgi:hypothetical protein